MHIPENYLSPQTCAVMTAVMIPVWRHAIKKTREEISSERMPLLGISAAFSFLGMMFNVPFPGGTTGHAVGGTLAAWLIGPHAACLALSIALFIQALFFGDGGVLAFGANCFNIAFLLPYVGYAVSAFCMRLRLNRSVSAAIGAYAGINVAALAAAVEFGIQPVLFHDAAGLALYCPYGLNVAVPAMLIPHLTIFGAAEVIFTVAVLAYLSRTSPELIERRESVHLKPAYLLMLIAILLVPLGLLAQGTAWGEWGAEEIASLQTGASSGQVIGYTPSGMANGWQLSSLFPDYAIGDLPEAVGYIISAVIGVTLSVIFFKLLSAFRAPKVRF